MKLFKTYPLPKAFETAIKRLALILLVPALFLFIYLEVLAGQAFYSYQHPEDSPSRLVQQISCPSLISNGETMLVTASVQNLNPETEPTVTVSISANHFDVPGETSTVHENLSDNGWLTPIWLITPKEAGKHIVTISAVTDDGLSDEASCQIIVPDFWGINPKIIHGFIGAILGANIGFAIGSLLEKLKRNWISE